MPRSPSSPIGSWWTCSGNRSRLGPLRRLPTARVDLHCHSTASDGEYPPAEVARRAHAAGLAAVALAHPHTTARVRGGSDGPPPNPPPGTGEETSQTPVPSAAPMRPSLCSKKSPCHI